MKHFSIFFAAVFALGLGLRADYLYWMVDQTGIQDAPEFKYAMISATDGGESTYLQLADNDGASLGTKLLWSGYESPDSKTGKTTNPAYADVSGYTSDAFSFFVELYNEKSEKVAVTSPVSYSALQSFIYGNMNQTGVMSPYTFHAVPEPTAGLLWLFGTAILALRRRRHFVHDAARVCSKGRVAAALVAAATVAGAGVDDTVLVFSTPGVDRYADGTKVMDGECYALVWTKKGCEFGGLTADCRAVSSDDRLVLIAPAAKGGRCPATAFEISSADAASFSGGTFGLYLLDTRVKDASGAVSLAKFDGARPQTVNSVGAANASARQASGIGNALAASAPVALGSVGVYTEIESPRIVAIRVEGAEISLQVEGMSPAADYFVVPGSQPGEAASVLDARPDGDTFTFPKPPSARFFKVIGTRKF